MNASALEQRVQECLDQREDPLDCPHVLAYLEHHPQALSGLVSLRAVGLHPTWPAPAKRGKLLPWKLASVAVAAALVMGLALHNPADLAPQRVEGPEPLTLLAKAHTPKLLSLAVTRSTSSSSKEVIYHQTNHSARVLFVSTKTTQNID